MTAPSVRCWYDANAPVLTSELGSFNDLLEAVLVDGYDGGNFPALGWTKEYEDVPTNKTVFRNSPTNGTGIYLRIQHHDLIDAYDYNVTARMYEVMSDVDNGAGPFQSEDRVLRVCQTAIITNAVPWWIIGDSQRFFIIVHYTCWNVANLAALRAHGSKGVVTVGFFGDLISLVPIDSMPALMGTDSGYSYNRILYFPYGLWSHQPTTYNSGYMSMSRDVTGALGPVSVMPFSVACGSYAISGNIVFPYYPTFGYLNYASIFVGCGDSVGAMDSEDKTRLRAMIPGMRFLGHQHESFEIGQQIDIDANIKYLFMRGSNTVGSVGGFLMDIGTGWDQLPGSIS